jgi:hypothetical protein
MPDYLITVQRVIQVTFVIKADNAETARENATTEIERLTPCTDWGNRYTRVIALSESAPFTGGPLPSPRLHLVTGP